MEGSVLTDIRQKQCCVNNMKAKICGKALIVFMGSKTYDSFSQIPALQQH